MTAHEDRFWELIDEVKTCMMVTQGDEPAGEPPLSARPMQAIPDRDANAIWFYTPLVSGKTNDLARDGTVCLAFGSPQKNDWVSVTGYASLSQDRELIKKHWSKFVDAWFPEGPDGENVGMIKVDVHQGEYWDSQSSKIIAAAKMLMASEQNERPDMGENQKLNFG